MLDSGREGAIFAGFTALLGLLQAFLSQSQQGVRARLLNLTTAYFVGHFLTAIAFFCVWKIPSSITWRHVAFQLLLENAWIEGLGITLCSCLKIAVKDDTLHEIFRCIAAMTYVLHLMGFLLLAIGQDNGKPMLFGAALLVPAALLVSFIRIRSSGIDISPRLHLLWIYSLFSIVCLVVLSGLRNDDTFLQANVIHISVASLVLVYLPFSRSSKIFKGLNLRSPRLGRTRWSSGMEKKQNGSLAQPHDCSLTSMSLKSETQRQSGEWVPPRAECIQETHASDVSSPPSPILPPAPIHHLSPRSNKKLRTLHDDVEDTSLTYAPGNASDNRKLVTTEVETFYSPRQDDKQLQSTWTFADGCGC